mmetsp:Transcript_24764/g.49478  ORF Transcript_24764/g.49478 Transcript_24764/m.49478 type:complete len:235 (-) Transcript_24764:433-1137(-)
MYDSLVRSSPRSTPSSDAKVLIFIAFASSCWSVSFFKEYSFSSSSYMPSMCPSRPLMCVEMGPRSSTNCCTRWSSTNRKLSKVVLRLRSSRIAVSLSSRVDSRSCMCRLKCSRVASIFWFLTLCPVKAWSTRCVSALTPSSWDFKSLIRLWYSCTITRMRPVFERSAASSSCAATISACSSVSYSASCWSSTSRNMALLCFSLSASLSMVVASSRSVRRQLASCSLNPRWCSSF